MKKAITKTLQTCYDKREETTTFLGDEMVQRVLKIYTKITEEEISIKEMENILYWVGDDAGMTVEKVIYLVFHEVKHLLNLDLLVDFFYDLVEHSFLEYLEELSFDMTLVKVYKKLGLVKRVDGEGEWILDVLTLKRKLSVWREIEDEALTLKVALPVFVRKEGAQEDKDM